MIQPAGLTLKPQCEQLQPLLNNAVKLVSQLLAARCSQTFTAHYTQYESLGFGARFNRKNHRTSQFDFTQNSIGLSLYGIG